jgi:alanine racemase
VLGQQERFFEAVTEPSGGCAPRCATCANSAATLVHPSAHSADLVRPGIAIYGRTPVPQVDDDFRAAPGHDPARARWAPSSKALPGRAGHQLRTRLRPRRGHGRRARGRRLRRRRPPQRDQRRPAPRRRSSHHHRRTRSAWTRSSSTWGRRSQARSGDVVTLFGGAPGEPTAQDWADADRHHQLRDRDAARARVARLYVGAAEGTYS